MKVLSTKTLDATVVAKAKDLQLDVTCLDFIEIKNVDFSKQSINLDNYDTIIFTSSNAIDSFINSIDIDQLKTKNIATLEGSTKVSLEKYGLLPTVTAPHSQLLSKNLIQLKNSQSVLHPCGSLALDTLKNNLESAGISYESLVVYETILQPQQLTVDYDCVLFYSPSGVNSFFSQNKLTPSMVCCCIGTTTAAALKEQAPTANILIPEKPNPLAMLEIVSHYNATIKRNEKRI